MKHTLLFCLALGLSFSAQGQDCSFAKKASCADYAKKHCNYSAAAIAASLNDNVISVFDTDQMKSRYMRKTVCEQSGTASFEELSFDHASGEFVSAKSYECDWSKCKMKKNCCIMPMSKAKVAVAAASSSPRQKRT